MTKEKKTSQQTNLIKNREKKNMPSGRLIKVLLEIVNLINREPPVLDLRFNLHSRANYIVIIISTYVYVYIF